MFKKATKAQSKLRLALQGTSGGGKTYSALAIGSHLGEKVAVIDTENGSASKYSDVFNFDVCELTKDYHPDRFINALKEAGSSGYDVVIIDSLTHAWNSTGGFLDLVDAEVKKQKAKGWKADSFGAWKELTPIYNRLVHAILSSPVHVIVTLRAKTEYQKVDGENGKSKIQKIGLAPEIRDNFQYEMDVEGMLDLEHNLVVGKTRCSAIDGRVYKNPGKDFADVLKAWLTTGVVREEVVEPTQQIQVMDNMYKAKLNAMLQSCRTPDALADARAAVTAAFANGLVNSEEKADLATVYMAVKREYSL